MPRCKSCNAEIVWARTDRGRRMPLERADDGNIVLRDVDRVRFIRDGRVQYPGGAAELRGDERRYVSHFATCPQAAAHRKP